MFVIFYSQLFYGMSPTSVNDFSSFNAPLTTKSCIFFLLPQPDVPPCVTDEIVAVNTSMQTAWRNNV